MHVLLIHQAFAAINEPGGTRHHELALYLAGCGHMVTIIASPISYLTGERTQEDVPPDENERIRVIRPWVYAALHRSFFHRTINFMSFMLTSFIAALRVKRIDLVWGTTPPLFQGITAWLVSKIKRVPFLFEVRDLWPAFAVAVGVLRNRPMIMASEWLEKALYKAADALVINSPGFRDHVEERGGKRVYLVPNGADVNMFHPDRRGGAFRRENDLYDHFVVLYAGAHGISNDLSTVLEAADLLRDIDGLLIVLLGDGKEKEGLKKKASEMHLSNVRFIDPIPKEEMTNALAAADVCLAILKPIELYKTVYPNKVFDYLAAGRPVILAMEGVIRDVVKDACAGLIVQPGRPKELAEAILLLMKDRHQLQRLGQNGRNYVEKHFSRMQLAEKMLLIMEDLIEDNNHCVNNLC